MKMTDTGKNPDVLDQAAVVTDFLTTHAVEAARERARPEHHPRFDGTHCVEDDCGIEIPKVRLDLGKVRCVDCQERLERLIAGKGRRL